MVHRGVYDITEFVESHPGGKQRIMLAGEEAAVSGLAVVNRNHLTASQPAPTSPPAPSTLLTKPHTQPSTHPTSHPTMPCAAGGSIEPFWGLYQQHQKAEIREILEGMRIGNVKGYKEGAEVKMADPFANEPKRWVGGWGSGDEGLGEGGRGLQNGGCKQQQQQWCCVRLPTAGCCKLPPHTTTACPHHPPLPALPHPTRHLN